jgi:hypothetical protein
VANKQVTFDRVPEAKKNVRVLGSLVFDMRETLGSSAYLDLRNVSQHQLLARDFVAALYKHASPGRIGSDYSVQSYIGMIRRVLRYCSTEGVLNEFKMADMDFEFLLSFRSNVRLATACFKSGVRRRVYGCMLRLLQAGQEIGLAHPDLQPPRNFSFVGDSDTTQPYSAGEALDIEDACRSCILVLLAQLEEGQRLLKVGKNPRSGPERDPKTGRLLAKSPAERAWNQLPNLLWYVVHAMGGQYLKGRELAAQGHSSFENATTGAWGGKYRKADVFRHLYPIAEDLIPFVILLAKTTGRNESSILGLRRDCLQELNGRYLLWYEKKRGGNRLHKKVVSDDGPFSPVALIRTLQRVTEPLVRHAAPEHQNKLLLGLTIQSHGLDPVKPLDDSYVLFQMNREGGWCDQQELLNAHGKPQRISFRRWRVYYLGRRYRKHGQLSKVSRDAAHTLSQVTVSYLVNDSTKHIHERAVEDGIQSAIGIARPIVLVDESVSHAAQMLSVDSSIAERVLLGEQDVLFAACKDFYNRPGGPPNTRCDKPWICLLCANAVITRHVLPRVLAFRDFMVQQREILSNGEWSEKFGQSWLVLTAHILPKFSTEAISEAERRVADQTLYIPITLKA